MPDCDYCDAGFDDEEAYLDHLASEHEGELTRIDQRRVENRSSGGGSSRTTLAAGVVGLLVVGAVAMFLMGGSGGNDLPAPGPGNISDSNIESRSLPSSGNQTLLQGVERFPEQGSNHVAPGTNIDYARIPPLSGTHYGQSASASFNEQPIQFGYLVHSLEHGAVVIYYDPGAMNGEIRQSLEEFVNAHTDPWASVIVAPNPKNNPESAFVLTAWRTRLRMDQYNPRVVFSFLAEYLGRGPENPVR